MSIFTFTVACGVSPTPTPTPFPTPCPCDTYSLENFGGAPRSVFYTDCRGISRTTPTIGPGVIIQICACSVVPQTNIAITNLGSCSSPDTPTPTPTRTPTPTPTATVVPTPTPRPNYTVSIYAKRSGTPTCIIPPGNGTEPQFRIYYTFGLPMPLQLVGGSIASNSCGFVGNITVPSGNTLYIGCRSWSFLSPIKFGVASGTACPDSGLTAYCGTFFDPGGGYSQVITGNTSLAFTSNLIPQYLTGKLYNIIDCYKFDYCGGAPVGSEPN